MLAQSLRATRPSVARIARHPTIIPSYRSFIVPTAARNADIVQDLYLREIKAYKPTPIKPTDADEHVQKFVAPKAPESPEEANLANDLKAYEQQVVEVEGQSGSEGEEAVSSALPEWMEDEPEEDEEKHAAH